MTVQAGVAVPGPGRWERDNSHFPLPISRYLWELFVPAYLEGAPLGFARYGTLIGELDLARVKGRVYQRAQAVTQPQELERRQRAAELAISTKLWRLDRAGWAGARERFRSRLLPLASLEPLAMDHTALNAHLATLQRIFHEGVVQHFYQQPASLFPVGDWVQWTCERTGANSPEVIALLRGASSETNDFLGAIDTVITALRATPEGEPLLHDVDVDPSVRLKNLRGASARLEAAFDAYMNEYADRIVAGFDVTDQTLRELPQFTLGAISSRFHLVGKARPSSPSTSAEAALRDRTPTEMREAFEEGLAEARVAYGLHDADIRITYLWPLGLIRRALLAASHSLAASGRLRNANDIFQATPSEVEALLTGHSVPSSTELGDRADEWLEWSHEDTPPAFGESEAGASLDCLRPACRRMNSAIAFYIAQMEARNLQPAQPSWSMLVEGIPASPGRYEGWARVIRGPEDFARLGEGDVLVARTTSPAYNILLPMVGAVVTDRGGALCHTAIIAREFGLPAVVGADQATARIPDGARVLVDGDRGFVAVRTG